MATIVPPQKPQAQTKTRLQYIVMVGALGFVLSLVAVFFVEARRRTPRGKDRPAPAGTQPVPAAAGPDAEVAGATDETMALRTVGSGGAGSP
ncbi:hypothetical protein [Streptomyces virginiae]|nr:hypothetical protein [Streptomyces virginiae]